MDRYNRNYEREGISVYLQITLGILTACFILGTIAGIMTYIKSSSEERQLNIIVQEFNKGMKMIGNSFKSERPKNYPIYTTPNIVIPKTRDQIVYEKSIKAYEEAIQGTSEFKKVYKKPKECEYLRDHQTRVYCANHFIRARKQWDMAHGLATK